MTTVRALLIFVYIVINWRELHGNLDGVNDPSNLVTGCEDCNLGKGRKNGNPPQLQEVGVNL